MVKDMILNGKHIGSLEGDTFTKDVKGSLHLMKIYDAWGLDLKMFDKFLKPINAKIIIHDKESGITYSTTASTYELYGRKKSHGYRDQIFLARLHFAQDNPNQQKLI